MHAVGLGVFLWLASSIALAGPTLRMDSREAPSEAERPRVHAPDARWLADLPHAASIHLGEPSESERAARDNSQRIRHPAAFGRKVKNENSKVIASRGQSALRFSIVSPQALHLRAALAFSDAGQYRVTAYRPGDEEHAVSLYRKPADAAAPAALWTPVTDGDTQVVVVERTDDAPSEWSVAVSQVSHFDRPLYQPNDWPLFMGTSAPCQVDMACVYQVAPTAMQFGVVNANFGVAMMIFTRSNGFTYLCTGTLLNSANYPSPLFLTAHHCLDDDEALSSLTTVWFYNRTACRSGPANPAVQVAGGARSLYGSASLDAALVVLNQMPPALATYVGWDATPMQPNTLILAIHHPAGDVKKASFGTELQIDDRPEPFPDLDFTFPPGTFYLVSWDLGLTEPGSSGSGLLSFDANTRLFHLRGTLTGGYDFTCSSIGKATTLYSRFDNLYPYIESALTGPAQPPAATTPAVEYYYADWNFYFETSFPDEIAALDGGAFGGAWKRTGQTFSVWPQPGGSASPTCRFFSTAFAPRSSHFYTPFSAECALVKTEPEWQYEAIAFYIELADDTGQCPAGTIPLYRAYNNGLGGAPNHRYTTSLTILNQMIAAGWAFEGNGNTKVFACVPQ